MDNGTYGYCAQRKGIAQLGSHVGTAHYSRAHFKAIGCNYVSLCSVYVVKKSDTGRTVRIVLDRFYYCGYTVFVSLKVYHTVFALMTTAKVTRGQVAFGVTSSA